MEIKVIKLQILTLNTVSSLSKYQWHDDQCKVIIIINLIIVFKKPLFLISQRYDWCIPTESGGLYL